MFERIVAAMELLRQGGVLFGTSTVFHTGNLDEVVSERYLDFLIERGSYIGGFLTYIPVGTEPAHHRVPALEAVRAGEGRRGGGVSTRSGGKTAAD